MKEIYRQAIEGVGGNELALTMAAKKRGRGRGRVSGGLGFT